MGKLLRGFLFHHHYCVVWFGGGNRGVFIKEVKEEINEGFLIGGNFLLYFLLGTKNVDFECRITIYIFCDVLDLRNNASRIFYGH